MKSVFIKIISYSRLVQPKLFGFIPIGSPYVRKDILALDIKVPGSHHVMFINKLADFASAFKDTKSRQLLKSLFYDYQSRYNMDSDLKFSLRNLADMHDKHTYTLPLESISKIVKRFIGEGCTFISYDSSGDQELIDLMVGKGRCKLVDALQVADGHRVMTEIEFDCTNAARIEKFWEVSVAKVFGTKWKVGMNDVYDNMVNAIHGSKSDLMARYEEGELYVNDDHEYKRSKEWAQKAMGHILT
jgi:hypothetical protein